MSDVNADLNCSQVFVKFSDTNFHKNSFKISRIVPCVRTEGLSEFHRRYISLKTCIEMLRVSILLYSSSLINLFSQLVGESSYPFTGSISSKFALT
jgi:hypothetical protein